MGTCRSNRVRLSWSILGIVLALLVLGSPGASFAEQLSSLPKPGAEEELIQCNFLPEPPAPQAAEAGALVAAARTAAGVGEGGIENVCGVEESLTNDGAVIIRFKTLVCGNICAISREEEWRERRLSTPQHRRVYLKRQLTYLYTCFDPSYEPAAGLYASHAPAYPSRISTRIFHDSGAWLCCGGAAFAEAGGAIHEILDQTYDLHWCVNRVDGENGEDRGVVQLASTATLRRAQLCSQGDGTYGICDDGDMATCGGDIEFAPQECFPEETQQGEYCSAGQVVSECNDPLENGEDPSVYDDDESVTLHVFAFDGFQNPGINQEWAATIGSSRPVNPDVRIDWHLFTQDKITPAVERLVNLSTLYPEDYFATSGFSWGGHSAIQLAKRARRRGVSLNLGFSCDPVPHSLFLPMRRPGNVGLWWNVFQHAANPSGRTVDGADANQDVTSLYESYGGPHMALGRNCDDGGSEAHLTLGALIDLFLAGLP